MLADNSLFLSLTLSPLSRHTEKEVADLVDELVRHTYVYTCVGLS